MTPDPIRASELATLLASHPDPFDWMRTHRVTQPGDPNRRQTVLPGLLRRWAQRRHLMVDPDPVLAPARRVVPRRPLV